MIGPLATVFVACCTALYPLFAALRSGKMQTVARPATGLPGALMAATSGSTAASI